MKPTYFDRNLRLLRLAANLKQKELGDIFGKTEATISLWESGKRSPIVADAIMVSEYFGVPLDEMICHDLSGIITDYTKTAAELELLDDYRRLTNSKQQLLLKLAKEM